MRRSRLAAVLVTVGCAFVAWGAIATLTASARGTVASAPGSSNSAALAHVASAKGKPIVVGSICSCSGPEASALGQVSSFISAWQNWANHGGGINGHPVKVIVMDDGDVASRALQDAKTLVEQDHIMALVGEFSEQDSAFVNYLTSQGVPLIGGTPTDTFDYTNPDVFPTGGTLPAAEYGQAATAKALGKTKFGVIYCAESPTCGEVDHTFGKVLSLIGGMKLVYQGEIAATAPTFVPQCLAEEAAHATATWIVDVPPITEAVVNQCAQQGYKPTLFSAGGSLNATVTKDPRLAGTIQMEFDLPYSDQTAAAGKLLHQVVYYYFHGTLSDTMVNVFAGLQMFRFVADRSKLTPKSTAENVKTAL